MFSKKIVKQRKSDQIVEEIISMVLSGKLNSGDRLPNENEIAEQFGVSRLTVREACKELSHMGVLDVRQGEGTFVAEAKPVNYMKRLLPLMVFTDKNADDLYDARIAIERKTSALAAKRRTADDLKELRKILDQTILFGRKGLLTNDYTFAVCDFHEYIAKISRNEFLFVIYTTIDEILTECIRRTALSPELREESLEEHEEIYKHIEAGDAQKAEEMMAKHIVNKKYFFQESINTN